MISKGTVGIICRLEWRRFPEQCVDRLTQIALTWVEMVFSWDIRKMDMWGDRVKVRSLFPAIKPKSQP
jgi:hypothetical protein